MATTKFFDRLVEMDRNGEATMIHMGYGGDDKKHYLCFVWAGVYWGIWLFRERRVKWSPMIWGDRQTQLEKLAGFMGYRSWKKVFYLSNFGKEKAKGTVWGRHRGQWLKSVTKLARDLERYHETVDGLDRVEGMLVAYHGLEILDKWWNLNDYQRERLHRWFQHPLFLKLGAHRRQIVSRRFTLMKEKKAWQQTFRNLHPHIANTMRKQIMAEAGGTPYHRRDREFLLGNGLSRYFGPLGQHNNPTTVQALAHAWPIGSFNLGNTLTYREDHRFLDAIRWMARNPGSEDLMVHLMSEVNKNQWSLNEDEGALMTAALPAVFEFQTPEHLQRLHDQVIPEINQMYTERLNQIMEASEKERSAALALRREKYPEFYKLKDELTAKTKATKDEWSDHLDEMELDYPGVKLLRTAVDFQTEGNEMHHCVGGYYRRTDVTLHAGGLDFGHLFWSTGTAIEEEQAAKLNKSRITWHTQGLYAYSIKVGEDRGTLAIWRKDDGKDVTITQNQFFGLMNRPVEKEVLEAAKAAFAKKGWDPNVIKAGFGTD